MASEIQKHTYVVTRGEFYEAASLTGDDRHQEVHRQIQSFKTMFKGQSLSPQEYMMAENAIIQYVQRLRNFYN